MADEAVQVPRLVVPGDVIFPKGRQKAEVVRGVSVVLHMADGTDVTYEDEDDVRMAPAGTTTVSMEEIQAAKQRELDLADEAIEREQQHLADLSDREQRLENLRAQREEKQKKAIELQEALDAEDEDSISEEKPGRRGQ